MSSVAVAPHQVTELDSGLRVVTERMGSARSVALEFWIGTGPTDGAENEAGLSHLLEHMLFRGTARYAPQEVDRLFGAIGDDLNAVTTHESTRIEAGIVAEHLPEAFDIMADMVWNPRIYAKQLEVERRVVLTEIATRKFGSHMRTAEDMLSSAIFDDRGFGRPVIGSAESVRGFSAGDLRAFHRAHYVPGNVVVAAAGDVDHDALVAMAERMPIERHGAAPPRPPVSISPPGRRVFVDVPDKRMHLALGGPGIGHRDPRRFALPVLNAVLGGTSSSRLVREIHWKRGLSHKIFSFADRYVDTGEIGVFVSADPESFAETIEIVAAELRRLREQPVTPEELQYAQRYLNGRAALANEATAHRAGRLGRSLLQGLPLLSIDEHLDRIEAVTVEDVAEVAHELLDPERFSAGCVGGWEKDYRAALAPISEALAA